MDDDYLSQLKADFLDNVTQGISEAIELQFKAKFERIEKNLTDLRSKIVHNGAKLQKLETKLDDVSQSALLGKVIVSGIDSSARDLPRLCEKILDRLKIEMGLTGNDMSDHFPVSVLLDLKNSNKQHRDSIRNNSKK